MDNSISFDSSQEDSSYLHSASIQLNLLEGGRENAREVLYPCLSYVHDGCWPGKFPNVEPTALHVITWADCESDGCYSVPPVAALASAQPPRIGGVWTLETGTPFRDIMTCVHQDGASPM